MGARIHNTLGLNGTWLEGEEFAYPNDTFTRRCFARCADGQNRVVKCKCADTFFSIPAVVTIEGKHVEGFVTSEDGTFIFNTYSNMEVKNGSLVQAAV